MLQERWVFWMNRLSKQIGRLSGWINGYSRRRQRCVLSSVIIRDRSCIFSSACVNTRHCRGTLSRDWQNAEKSVLRTKQTHSRSVNFLLHVNVVSDIYNKRLTAGWNITDHKFACNNDSYAEYLPFGLAQNLSSTYYKTHAGFNSTWYDM